MSETVAEAARGTLNPPSEPGAADPEKALIDLERRYEALCRELAEVEQRLRSLRTAADLCALCGGTGERWVRGGLYGEMQRRSCPCRDAD